LGLTLKTFNYNYEQYKADEKIRTELESKKDFLESQLASKAFYAFSELYIALIHLKVMRAFIDGVLRFGISPRFYIGIVVPFKGQDKNVLTALNDRFDDKSLSGMYAGGKEEGGAGVADSEDFFSFVSIPLNTPMSMMQ